MPYFAYPFANSVISKITDPGFATFTQGLSVRYSTRSLYVIGRVVVSFAFTNTGAPEPRGQRWQLPPFPKQCGGSTGAAGCLFYQNCTSNVVCFSHELKLKTVFKQFRSYLNLNSSQKRYQSVSTYEKKVNEHAPPKKKIKAQE
jgi:hypothetical protein